MCLWGANQKELLQFKTFLGNSVQYVPVPRLGKWPKGCCAEKHTWHQLLLFYPPIDHGFSFSSLSSLFIRLPRAFSRLVTVYFPWFPQAGRLPGVQLCWISSTSRLNLQKKNKKKPGFLLRYHYLIIWFSRLWKVTTFIQGFKKEDREIIRLWISTPTWSDFILITFAQTVTKAGEVCGGQRGFKDTSPHRVC